MKKSVCFVISILSFILLWSVTARAVTVCPDPVAVVQPNGETIQLYPKGDEFLSWLEDEQGYLLDFDESKEGFCYAEWSDNGPVSNGELVGEVNVLSMLSRCDKGSDIPRIIRDKAEQTREQVMPAHNAPLTPPILSDAPNSPVVNNVSALKRNLLIIYVRWQNESNIQQLTPFTGQQIYNLVFNSATNSVNSYYRELFNSQEDIIVPATVSSPLGGYQGILQVTLTGSHTNPGDNTALQFNLLKDAMQAASLHINFATYDTNGDGVLQTSELSIGVVIHGYERSSGGTAAPTPNFHGSSFSGWNFGTYNGVRVNSIFGQGAYHQNNPMTIGVLCHELGHSGYGFIDTYDYGTGIDDGKSQGQGYWSLMSNGNWGYRSGENSGASPTYVDAYNLTYYGIVTPGLLSQTTSSIQLNSHLDIYKVTNTVDTKQYFLLQERKYGTVNNYDRGAFYRINSTSNTATGGLIIYHIDENVTLSRINDKNTHYRAGIEEAHGGIQHLQQVSGGNSGGLDDLWGMGSHSNKYLFSQASDPSSGLYSAFTNNTTPPNQNTSSDVTLSNITWNSASGSISVQWSLPATPTIEVTTTGLTNLKVGQAVSGASVLYTLSDGIYTSSINSSHFTVAGLPPGLTAGSALRTSDTIVTVPITGIPTTYSVNTTSLTYTSIIPVANITDATIAIIPTGTIIASTVARGDGAAVSGAPIIQSKTANSVTVNAVTNAGTTGQSVEYTISTSGMATPLSGWQNGTTFSDLNADTTYYVYARTEANDNYDAGLALVSTEITLSLPPPNLIFSVGNVQSSVGKEVLVPIHIANNFNALDAVAVTVTFDSTRLEWQNLGTYVPNNAATHPWTLGGFIPLLSTPGSIGINSATFYFMDLNGITTQSGTLVTLKLRVKNYAPAGDAAITLSFSSVGDSRGALNSSQYDNEPGKIAVSDIVYGDVNGDGVVDAFDALYLARHLAGWPGYETISLAADVNNDGIVDAFDALYLARHLAEWPGYEILGPK
ncbi:MAG: dockerin type I domain-containing protein [Oscillospiraceae bacterium]|nr:dockerin type I domain-containing protein [Oscillospiraceae bacterium]